MVIRPEAESPTELQKKNGQQAGKENVQRVREYLDELKLQKQFIPLRDGKPNYSAIALACGFNRQVFYNNQAAREAVEQAFQELNLETQMEPVSTDRSAAHSKAAHTQKQLDTSERYIQELEAKLAVKTAEVESLRQKLSELEVRLQQASIFEEVITTNGRRYIP